MTFRIRYAPGPTFSGSPAPPQMALVEAPSAEVAVANLCERYRVRRVLSVSIRCAGVVTHREGKAIGAEPVKHRCYRFSQSEFCPVHRSKGGS